MIKYQQGRFIDSPKYKNWSDTEKEIADKRERCLVRSFPNGNAICQCNTPEDAIWIAQRLNMAAQYEQNSKLKSEEDSENTL